MIYILVRTSNRPKYFKRCIESIKAQVVDEQVRVIIGNDDPFNDYIRDYPEVSMTILNLERDNSYDIDKTHCIDTAKYFPYNGYLNKMLQQCTEQGWVMILDDDDFFSSKFALQRVTQQLKSDTQMAFLRVSICGNIIPSDKNWGKHPVLRDMSMIGFMFHTKYIPLLHVAPYKQADYRLAAQLYDLCEPVFINEILTTTDNEGQGRQMDCTI